MMIGMATTRQGARSSPILQVRCLSTKPLADAREEWGPGEHGTNNNTASSGKNHPLLLAHDIRTRQTTCNETLNIDYMDFFYVVMREDQGWFEAKLPSDLERHEYHQRLSWISHSLSCRL
jgi:hypothetical protein